MSSGVPQKSTTWIDHNVKPMDCGFRYDALSQEKSFRLLKLLPSSDTSSPIICTMSEQRIDDSIKKYTALSYTWGNIQDKKEIILNGRPALVTQNLHMALQQIRHMPGMLGAILQPLSLWIDALCINQQDKNEKAVQIGYMHQIFANAQWVVAWLGPEGDESGAIMDVINQGNSIDVGSIPAPALLSFLSRSWWTRAWVLQECMAASAASFMWLVCGSSSTAFIHQGIPLFDIIKLSSKLEATDSRDKIFALLGLVDGQTKSQIRPDYTLSPCEIFCK
ncbi:HET-domain-containing protein, partial [Eremomyces bilateralis CBS 781.70]